jgi:hypothetical protein
MSLFAQTLNARITDPRVPGLHLWFGRETHLALPSLDTNEDLSFPTAISPDGLAVRVKKEILGYDEHNRVRLLSRRSALNTASSSPSNYLVLQSAREMPYVTILNASFNEMDRQAYVENYLALYDRLKDTLKKW